MLESADSEKHHRDRLTDALSRPHFLELLEQEARLANHSGHPFVLCLIDVDQLRNINDGAGQRCGDSVIAGIAERVRSVLDSPPWGESVYLHARFDGDSLMVFVPGCSITKGAQLAEAVRSRVATTPFAGNVRATVSVAVVGYRLFESTDEVVARAEHTLFIAKQFGRDCVEVAETPPADPHVARVIPFEAPHGRRPPRAS